MKNKMILAALATLCGSFLGAQEKEGASSGSVQFVTVDKDVKLEVVDWGGSGRPLVLLAALGATAHAFEGFAHKLVPRYHVYGITRRGFGASSAPDSGYSSDRLGDDVLAVIEALKLDRPVLVGHSMAGEELSSVGSRHPEEVAGLIYLDAAYAYAYYDRSVGDLKLDSIELRTKLGGLLPGGGRPDQRKLTEELIEEMAQVDRELKGRLKMLGDAADPPKPAGGWPPPSMSAPIKGMIAGMQKYTDIRCPVLAIFAVPHDTGDQFKGDPAANAKADADDVAFVEPQANAVERGIPSARVVRIPHGSHYIYGSNEADVLREMNIFLENLP